MQSAKAKARQANLNKIKLQIIDAQSGRCNNCAKEIRADGLGVDLHHKRKRSLGGTDIRENLEALCQWCHRIIKHGGNHGY